ncbi:hypothetical protein ES703_24197 [subsurface metagenome]
MSKLLKSLSEEAKIERQKERASRREANWPKV